VFGREFAQAVAVSAVGDWQGPVRSSYGVHLVRVDKRVDARIPKLAEVRTAVERDWLRAHSEKAEEAFYQALRARYSVRIETDANTGAEARVGVKTP
jgi:parvulin-like peptidyl-prolyl isomerase